MTITWEPPSGGMWDLETVHVQGGQPRIFQERAPRAFKAGFQSAAERYGLPIDYLDMRFVNDHCYVRMRAVGAPEPTRGKPARTPPAGLLKLLARVHPVLRRRAKAARRAIEDKVWLDERRRWMSNEREDMLATGRQLQAEPVDSIDDTALVAHLRRAADHFEHGIRLHLDLTPIFYVPVGRLLLATRGWAIPDADVFAILGGSSPASVASASALAAIARACTEAGVEPRTLADIRTASAEASRALDEYLESHGWRITTQYSPRGLALIELPDLIVQAIRTANEAGSPAPLADVGEVRGRIPSNDRERFDDLLADARACYGVRDDNVAITFIWPAGLLRRAMLEAGGRLATRGLVADAAHVFALGESEIAAALVSGRSFRTEAQARVARLEAAEAADAPAHLGDSEGPPPDPATFPKAMAEVVAAIVLGFDLEQAFQGDRKSDAWTGEGVGIGTTPYTGRACVAASAEDALTRLAPGDVLVTTLTTPAFEAVMPIAGALVTENGGLMSHAALVCREYGIPAVVGVAGATAKIVDGSTVTVDPSTNAVVQVQLAGPADTADAITRIGR
jgi:pyruvate,water dikinase